jgi:hypothetical protein
MAAFADSGPIEHPSFIFRKLLHIKMYESVILRAVLKQTNSIEHNASREIPHIILNQNVQCMKEPENCP